MHSSASLKWQMSVLEVYNETVIDLLTSSEDVAVCTVLNNPQVRKCLNIVSIQRKKKYYGCIRREFTQTSLIRPNNYAAGAD
jgi:hypothetical protein